MVAYVVNDTVITPSRAGGNQWRIEFKSDALPSALAAWRDALISGKPGTATALRELIVADEEEPTQADAEWQ
jgi:hypothetical protein